MDAKQSYLLRLKNTITSLAGLEHSLVDLEGVYNARQYGAGGANAISADDLAQAGMTANQLQLSVFLCHQIAEFLNGRPASDANYIAIVNELRTDI